MTEDYSSSFETDYGASRTKIGRLEGRVDTDTNWTEECPSDQKIAKNHEYNDQGCCSAGVMQNDAFGITGLYHFPNFLTEKEEKEILKYVDSCEWNGFLKRRVQHYGFKYDYATQSVAPNSTMPPIPSQMDFILDQIEALKLFPSRPDQLIINEYTPGQGIARHIDKVDSFGPVVASLSLGSNAIMEFQNGSEIVPAWLEKGSLAVLTGDARYNFTHACES